MLLTDRFAGKIFTPNNFYTNFFGTETLTILFATVYGDRCFLYRTFSAQKCYAQKVLRTKNIFIQMSSNLDACARKRMVRKNFCTQHTFTHNWLLHGELCFPFVITYPSHSPFHVTPNNSGDPRPSAKNIELQPVACNPVWHVFSSWSGRVFVSWRIIVFLVNQRSEWLTISGSAQI